MSGSNAYAVLEIKKIEMQFIKYQRIYREQCLELLASNMAAYFVPEEFEDFKTFLGEQQPQSPYFVLLAEQLVVGCGGYELLNNKVFLRWGIITNKEHNSGLGTLLLEERIKHIRKNYKSVDIHLFTSPMVQGFYLKQGFIVESVKKDGLALGIDTVNMKLVKN